MSTKNTEATTTPDAGTRPLSTTERLFPETVEQATSIAETPAQVSQTEDATAENKARDEKGRFAKTEAGAGTNEHPEETEPEFMALDAYFNKKTRVKIDGVEKEVTIADIVRGYQTDQYLTQKGQRVAAEKQELIQARRLLDELMQQPQRRDASAVVADESDPIYTEYVKPVVSKLEAKIVDLEARLSGVAPIVEPLRYQSNVQKVDARLKQEGFSDFMEYLPKVEATILAMPDEQQAQYDTMQGFESVYKDIKLKEMLRRGSGNAPASRIDPPPTVESSSVSSGATQNSTAKDAFDRARQSGSTQDWAAALIARGVI